MTNEHSSRTPVTAMCLVRRPHISVTCRRFKSLTWLSLPLLALLVTSPLEATPVHPVHETVSEVEWNADTHRLEVALRLDALDEQWLQQRLAGGKPTPQWAVEYLKNKFRIRKRLDARRQDTTSYHWIGREERGAHVWWFFEIEPRDEQPAEWIEQKMLFEREPNYTHRVLVLGQPSKRSLNLNARRPKASLKQAQDDAPVPPVDR